MSWNGIFSELGEARTDRRSDHCAHTVCDHKARVVAIIAVHDVHRRRDECGHREHGMRGCGGNVFGKREQLTRMETWTMPPPMPSKLERNPTDTGVWSVIDRS
jgi:hypothetical protein